MSDLDSTHETYRDTYSDSELRALAVKRLKAKRDFRAHLLAFVTVNLFLVAIWYVTGAGFFWPVFPIFGWGIGVAFNAWDVYSFAPTRGEIAAETERLRRRSG